MELPTNTFKRGAAPGQAANRLVGGTGRCLRRRTVRQRRLRLAGDRCRARAERSAQRAARNCRRSRRIRCIPSCARSHGSVELIKQYLDIGAQTLHDSHGGIGRAGARAWWPRRATRPAACAASAARLARASRWNQIDDYLQRSDEQMCVLVQVESVTGLTHLERDRRGRGRRRGVLRSRGSGGVAWDCSASPRDPAVQDGHCPGNRDGAQGPARRRARSPRTASSRAGTWSRARCSSPWGSTPPCWYEPAASC